MGVVEVRFLGPEPETHVPDIGGPDIVRGGTVKVSAAVAGRGPGEWVEVAVPVDGQACERLDDGPDGPRWRCRDLGAGLLAQTDRWAAVEAGKGKTTAAGAAAGEGER